MRTMIESTELSPDRVIELLDDAVSWFYDGGNELTDLFVPCLYRLPHGKGFLIGYNLRENTRRKFEYSNPVFERECIYDDEDDAKRAAISECERRAEQEAEYQTQWHEAYRQGFEDGRNARDE